MSRRLSPRKRLAFAAVTVSLLLLGLEGALRLLGYPTGLVRSFSHLWNHDPASLARLPGLFQPSARLRVAWPPALAYDASFNALGLRGPEVAAAPTALRVLALGDSVTFGYYVADAETWPARLEARLRAGGLAAEVLNGGCGHFTITDERRWLEEKLLALRPDVVVVQFCTNDVLDLELDRSPLLYEQILADAASGEAGGLGDRLRETAVGEVQLRLALWLKSRRAEPATAMAPPTPVPEAQWSRYEAELGAVRDLLRARGVALLVVAFPDLPAALDPGPSVHDAHLAAICARLGVPFRSPLDLFRAAPDPHALYLWPLDPHPSARGCDALAQAAQELLAGEHLLAPRR